MSTIISIIITLGFIILMTYITSIIRRKNQKTHLIYRFRKAFTSPNKLKTRLLDGYSNLLMSDPEKNINISPWESEEDLREKADIHRARLSKFGRSKMNNEILFSGESGEVFKYTPKGEKRYL